MFNPFYTKPSRFQDPPGRNPPDNRFRRSPFRVHLHVDRHYYVPISTSKARNTRLCVVHVLRMDTKELTHKELKSGIAYLERLLPHLERISRWASDDPILRNYWHTRAGNRGLSVFGFQSHQLKEYDTLVQRLFQKKKSFYLALLRFHDPNAFTLSGDSSSSDDYDSEY